MYKRKITDFFVYLIPCFIVLIIMLIVYFIKHMYPFGSLTTLQIDADYNYVPVLFKIHDIFHYGDNFFWDFKLGGGANIYGSLVLNSIFSPLNWLVIFVKRNNIVNFFNILVIIKFMFMSFTMFFFIRKNFSKVDLFWQVIMSLLYVFSGWGFLMYSNIFFIDTIIMFPIVVHFLIKLFREYKCLGLIISLSYCLVLNFYLSYMIYLFIIFSSLVALILLVEKDNRNKIIFNLSFSLVLPLIISSFSHLPTIYQVLTSIRNSSDGQSSYFYYFFLKFVYLIMSSFIVCLFFKLFKLYKDNKDKYILFYIIMFILTTIGVLVEPINRAWHTGSYNSLPYRYSFIPIFIMICGSLRYLSSNVENRKKINIFIVIFCLICIFLFIFNFNGIVTREMIAFDITKPGIFIILLIVFSFLFLCHMYSFGNSKKQKLVTGIIIFIEIIIYSNWCFCYYNYHQCVQSLYYEGRVQIDDDTLYKYVDYQASLGVNSSYITRNATLANWHHIIPNKQLDFISNFGYSVQTPLIYGYGGTVLSDALVGVKYVYSAIELPSELFVLVDSFKYDDVDVYFYQMKYDFSFGMFYDSNFSDISDNDFFDTNNYYYRKMFDIDYDVINVSDFSVQDDSLKNYKFKLKNNDKVLLYMEITDELLESGIKELKVNDENIFVGNSSKIVYIGFYDSDLSITVDMIDDKETHFSGIKFGSVKIDDYKKLVKKINVTYYDFSFDGSRLHLNVDSEKEQSLFLPINNIPGWKAKLNGESVDINDTLYTFMGIKLNKGNNDIVMDFEPPYLKAGVCCSIVGLLLTAFYMFFRNKMFESELFCKIVVFLYYFVSISLFVFVYILSNILFI